MNPFARSLLLFACATLPGCTPASPRIPAPARTPADCAAIEFNETSLRRAAEIGLLPAQAIRALRPNISFSDPRSVLRHVMEMAPSHAVVYPTERYYYYCFPLGPRLVSGNIRFADAENGGISIGYFDTHNPGDMETMEFRDGEGGVRIALDPSSHEVRLAVDGLRRTFVLDQGALEAPSFSLLEGEEFVSGVRDESGYYFDLIYWRPGRSFYYVLNPTRPLPETWSRGDSTKLELWWGDRSRFCFLHEAHTGRFILVGVHQREIRENGWYDGPFDQVPPNLPIRGMLEEAYPYVQDAGGLDEHGNFLRMHGQRVAISPYQEYLSGTDLEKTMESAILDKPDPGAWTTATYEYKRDWRAPTAIATPGGHVLSLSSSWPANHWGNSSASWGAAHEEAVSASWPPNHAIETSSSPH